MKQIWMKSAKEEVCFQKEIMQGCLAKRQGTFEVFSRVTPQYILIAMSQEKLISTD